MPKPKESIVFTGMPSPPGAPSKAKVEEIFSVGDYVYWNELNGRPPPIGEEDYRSSDYGVVILIGSESIEIKNKSSMITCVYWFFKGTLTKISKEEFEAAEVIDA